VARVLIRRTVAPHSERRHNYAVSSVDFDPADLARTDPYPLLARLRDAGPVTRLANGFWAVTGYAAAMETLCHRGCGSSPIAMRYLDGLPPGAARDEMSRRINFLDPPDHHRVRSLVSKAFTPRRIADLVPWIAATADRLFDELAGMGQVEPVGAITGRSCHNAGKRTLPPGPRLARGG
jgi:cytochrome P450